MSKKILVVEDEDHLRTLLHDTLILEGFEVLSAETGEEAMELAAAEHPDLAFVDIGLPGCDGWEVCRRLQGNPELRGIRLVVHTALTRGGVSPQVRELGIRHYMFKPYDMADVVDLMRRVLKENWQ